MGNITTNISNFLINDPNLSAGRIVTNNDNLIMAHCGIVSDRIIMLFIVSSAMMLLKSFIGNKLLEILEKRTKHYEKIVDIIMRFYTYASFFLALIGVIALKMVM